MTLTEVAIKRPTLIVVIFAVLGVLGVYSYIQLKYELLPKISVPVVVITTPYPGASPNEVETSVSKVIEDAVSGLDNLSAIHTTSGEGISFVTIEFTQTANSDISLQDAQRKVGEILSKLPSGAKSPSLTKIALDDIPVLRMGLTSKMPSRQFYQYVKDHLKPRLSNIAGVGQVTLVGGDQREIQINLDAKRLRAYGLSVSNVTQTIKQSNVDFPTGNIKDADGQFVVRIAGKYTSIEDIRRLVLAKSKDGGSIRVQDVAEVVDGVRDFENASRIDGVSSIGMLVQKQTDANSVEVSRLVRAALKKIEAENASIGLKFNIAQDGSTFTIDAADAVKHDLMVAIILVALVMLVFFHSVRNSVIVMIAIPASLISSFTIIFLFGFSLNLMTLLGMSLVIGILVDDSIVVLENIYRHMELGEERRSAALKGRNEIGFAALSITLVDVVVFVPLALTGGLIGNIVREFAIVVVSTTLLSLFVSFTITPLLASRFSKIEDMTRGSLMARFGEWFEYMFKRLTEEYKIAMNWAFNHKRTVFVSTGILFFASVALVPLGFIGSEFMTQTDRGEFTVSLEMPTGVTIEQTNAITRRVERIVGEMPEVARVFANVGTSSEGLIGQTSNNISELNIALTPRNTRQRSTDDVGRLIKKKALEIPGVKVRINPIGIFGTANQTPILIVVSGNDIDSVYAAARTVMDVVKHVPGSADVRQSAEEGRPETRIEIDREKLTAFGLTMNDVGSSLRIALSGDDDSKFREGQNEYPIRVRLDEFDRSRTADVGSLAFLNKRGEQIELKQFAKIYSTVGPTKLQREDRLSAVSVFSQAQGRPSGSIVQDIRAALAKVRLPGGIKVAYLGDEKNRSEGFGSLGLALLAAILFVYMIMVALYDSYLYPFVVLFSIPVAIVGALLALALTMNALSVFSILGIIMLVGLVGKNAILLVDRANQMRASRQLDTIEALLEAGETRLRPILMTTVAMVFGMLPIALGAGASSEWKSGLAWALVGGLTSSMFLTLIVVPVIYVVVDRWRETVPAFLRSLVRVLRPAAKREKSPDTVPAGAELGETP